MVVLWRAALGDGDDFVRQRVTIESGRGEPSVADITLTGTPRNPLPAGPAPAAEILAGPYLQNPGPSSVTVMWVTGPNAAGWLEYGRDGTTPTQVLPVRDGLIDANTRVHRVTLTGLDPDTSYTYRIVTRPIVSFGPYKVDYGEHRAQRRAHVPDAWPGQADRSRSWCSTTCTRTSRRCART